MRISQSTIARNGALEGGGIVNEKHGTLTLTNTAVIDNGVSRSEVSTGGLENFDGWLTVTNRTFTGNDGTAISNGGTLTLVNTTVAENTSGLCCAAVLVNTILARNAGIDPVYGSQDCVGTITSQGNNLIGDSTGCTITGQGPNLTGDPGLDDFTDDDTLGSGHFPLLPTSQAINAGNPAVRPKTDQLRENRVGICDIGSIEFQGTAVSSR